jgi:GntR family transcriptional regulator, transcriptional repressor for pyruvate dehydrogenase complex
MELQPVARLSVSDAVFTQLQAEILAGRVAPGEALPSERSLTETLGVNRQAVREALKRLDQAGLVEINHGGVTRALDYRRSAGLDLLTSLLVRPDGSIDAGVARSIMEMRACIGPDAARLCAQRGLEPVLTQLHATVDAMAALGDDLAGLSALDWRFWELVVDGADNVAYQLAFNSLRAGAAPVQHALPAITADELRDLDGHRAIADAIGRGHHIVAADAARRLLQRGLATATTILSSLGDPS